MRCGFDGPLWQGAGVYEFFYGGEIASSYFITYLPPLVALALALP